MTGFQSVHSGLPMAALERLTSSDVNKLLANVARLQGLAVGRIWDPVGVNANASTAPLGLNQAAFLNDELHVSGGAASSEANHFHTPDGGLTWYTSTISGAGKRNAPAFGNGKVVVTGGASNAYIATASLPFGSASGSFAGYTCSGITEFLPATYANGLWVAPSYSEDLKIATSTDGTTWTARTATGSAPFNSKKRRAIFAGGIWMVPAYSPGSQLSAFTSSDGTSWTQTALPVSSGGDGAGGSGTGQNGVAYGNGVWLLANNNASAYDGMYVSANGTTWTAQTISARAWNVPALLTVGSTNIWIATHRTAANADLAVSTNNGTTWTLVTIASGSATTTEVVVGGGVAMFCQANKVFWSLDGRSWCSQVLPATIATPNPPVYTGSAWVITDSTTGNRTVLISGAL